MSRRIRVGKLDSVQRVGLEIRRIYGKVRNGDIVETADGLKLVNILLALKQCHEVSEFERRLAAIESTLGIPAKPVVVKLVPKDAKP